MADAVEVDELPDTERGAGGFGSTGVAALPSDNSNSTGEILKKPRLEEK